MSCYKAKMTKEDLSRAIVTIGKDKLSSLPAAEYRGRICVIDKPEDVKKAVEEIKKEKIIGFDTETRPSFRRGQSYNLALIQLSTPKCTYLFRTNMIGYPKELIEIFENPEITKVGLSIHDDFHQLRKITDFEPQGFIDLQSFVKNYRIADNSLSRLYGILFGKRISKGQRLTNWEQAELSDAQKSYAALDASACVKIYNYLKDGNFNPLESEYLTFPPEPEPQSEESPEP